MANEHPPSEHLNKSQTKCWERIVSYYLRFNGYFTVDNFIVHSPVEGDDVIPPATEVDTLAVRRPSTVERILNQYEIEPDAILVDATASRKTDLIIAEAKAIDEGMVNRLWHSDKDVEHHLDSIEYLLRRFGLDPNREAAEELRARGVLEPTNSDWRVRLIYFPLKSSRAVAKKGIQQITLSDVITFSALRAQSWFAWELGQRSIHREWDPIVIRLWEECMGKSLDDGLMRRVRELIVSWDCSGSRVGSTHAKPTLS